MCYMIREYMGAVNDDELIGGVGEIVELDETFIGGRQERSHRGGNPSEGTAIVLEMLEVDDDVVTEVVPSRIRVTILPIVRANVKACGKVRTDKYRTFAKVGSARGMAYTRKQVIHAHGEYIALTGATVNALEGY